MNEFSEYEKLLDEAKKSLPDKKNNEARFEVPNPVVQQQGRQTIVKNFGIISKALRRDPKHIAKFLFKELAVPGSVKETELVLIGKLKEDVIRKRIHDYLHEYVLCYECGKPDTSIDKREKNLFIKCEACGASRPIKKV